MAGSTIVAELQLHCSRPHAPTRRLALGTSTLPCDPAPGFGGLLLGGVVARFAPDLDPDSLPEVERLTTDVERGRRISQPRLRHRLQQDRVGLTLATHRLVARGESLTFDLDDRGAPAQHVLGAVYALGTMPIGARPVVASTLRRALTWGGPIGADLLAVLSGRRGLSLSSGAVADPRGWALERLGFTASSAMPTVREVQRRYRDRLRDVHPDHGAASDDAATLIAELSEARRLLIGR